MSNSMPNKSLNQKRNSTLLKSTERLQVELQGLQFLLAQEITMEQYATSVITFEVESLIREIQHLGTTIREKTS